MKNPYYSRNECPCDRKVRYRICRIRRPGLLFSKAEFRGVWYFGGGRGPYNSGVFYIPEAQIRGAFVSGGAIIFWTSRRNNKQKLILTYRGEISENSSEKIYGRTARVSRIKTNSENNQAKHQREVPSSQPFMPLFQPATEMPLPFTALSTPAHKRICLRVKLFFFAAPWIVVAPEHLTTSSLNSRGYKLLFGDFF